MRLLDCRGKESLTSGQAGEISGTVRSGGVLIFPTDTFYALGADPCSGPALEKVRRLKKRGAAKPLLLLVEGLTELQRFAAAVPEPYPALMRRFWPGPLTLLFPAREGLPPPVVSEKGRIALRVPGSPLCRAVLRAAGGSLTGTSANPAGGADPVEPGETAAALGPGPDLMVDAGTLTAARESTLLELHGGRPVLLREGAIARGEIEAFLKKRRKSLLTNGDAIDIKCGF